MTTASGTEFWTQSSDKYIMAPIQSVEETLAENGTDFHLNASRLSVQAFIQQQIRVLGWEQKDIGTTKN